MTNQDEDQIPSNTDEPTAIQAPEKAKKRVYSTPKLTKKRSVARVTLFSGGGAIAGGLTASG